MDEIKIIEAAKSITSVGKSIVASIIVSIAGGLISLFIKNSESLGFLIIITSLVNVAILINIIVAFFNAGKFLTESVIPEQDSSDENTVPAQSFSEWKKIYFKKDPAYKYLSKEDLMKTYKQEMKLSKD